MRNRLLSAVTVVCLAQVSVGNGGAQTPAAPAASASAAASSAASRLKQVAYIKASNTHANDHFGNGGALEGHGLALSGDGNDHGGGRTL